MGVILDPRPLPVFQGTGPRCWAAAMTSWLTVNKNRPQLNLQQLINRYGNPSKDPKVAGSIDFKSPKFSQLKDDFSLNQDIFVFNSDTARRAFFGIQKRLRTYGYLIVIIHVEPGISHALAAFGIQTLGPKGAVLRVMDPAKGDYDERRLDFLFDKGVLILSTLEPLGRVRKPFPTFTTVVDGPPVTP